ncbi:MAG: hypothetical protein LBG69_09000 [Zoogloeaceae bacterium]|jgi:hypothetical protein|nr:hypothetical protein [Zoogloeaceae bacterium]
MKIESSQIAMQTERKFSQATVSTVSSRLVSRAPLTQDAEKTGAKPGIAPPAADGGSAKERVNLSDAGKSLASSLSRQNAPTAASLSPESDFTSDDPKIAILAQILEMLTGHKLEISDLRSLQKAANGDLANSNFEMERTTRAQYTEREDTRFSAQGVVRTADGLEVSFSVNMAFSRSYSKTVTTTERLSLQAAKDPLVLDFGGRADDLANLSFFFDLNADGTKQELPLLRGSGFLAFDRNGNGRIDDGRELFGPASGNGFRELAALDDDGNGWIDENDAAYLSLRIWRPEAGGQNGEGELLTLKEAGIGAIYLGNLAAPFTFTNGDNSPWAFLRSGGVYLREDGGVGTVSQVDLVV